MTTPDSGADKFRDKWVPVPLREKTYDADAKTYVIEFEAPKQLMLNPQFEAMVHDELLRNADRDGLMIEGQVVVTTRDKDEPKTVAKPEPPEPTEQDEVEVDKVESPYKMSDKELEFRQRLRQNVEDTANEAFGFVAGQLDGKPLPEGRQFKVDRDAFMAGFHGEAVFQRPMTSKDFMVVRAEAIVAMSLSTVDEAEKKLAQKAEDDIDKQIADFEIPDDLSELDE